MFKKSLAVAVACYTTVTFGSTVEFQNLTGSAITASANLIIPDGTSRYEITSLLSNEWASVYGVTLGNITKTNSYVVTFTAGSQELAVVADTSTPARSWSWFWAGFTAFFISGLTATGARWARQLIAGGSYE